MCRSGSRSPSRSSRKPPIDDDVRYVEDSTKRELPPDQGHRFVIQPNELNLLTGGPIENVKTNPKISSSRSVSHTPKRSVLVPRKPDY